MFHFLPLSEQKIFILLAINSQQVCQNCAELVQSTLLRNIYDGFVVWKKFPEFEENFSAVCQRKLSVKVKTALHVLERKKLMAIFGKKNLTVQVLRTNHSVGCCVEFFAILLETAFLVSGQKNRRNFIFSDKIFQVFMNLRSETFSKFVRTSFWVSNRTNWEKYFSVKKRFRTFRTFSIKVSGWLQNSFSRVVKTGSSSPEESFEDS